MKQFLTTKSMMSLVRYAAIGCLIISARPAVAQLSPVRQGALLEYVISVSGQPFPMYMRVDSLSAKHCRIAWSYENGRSGIFIMNAASLDSARLSSWDQPVPGESAVMPKEQTVLIVSKTVLAELKTRGSTMYNSSLFTLQPAPRSGVELPYNNEQIIYAVADDGMKLWILNDPDFPMIVKAEGNPYGVDAELVGIH